MPGADRHGWRDVQGYLSAHDSWLARYSDYFLLEIGLNIEVINPSTLLVSGRIHCVDGRFVDVSETLEMNDRQQVRTAKYSYHAGISGSADRPAFRYDNYHVHSGHADEHHRHRYDFATWREIKPPEWVGRHDWPTLGDVLDELYEWWSEIGQFAFNSDQPDAPIDR